MEIGFTFITTSSAEPYMWVFSLFDSNINAYIIVAGYIRNSFLLRVPTLHLSNLTVTVKIPLSSTCLCRTAAEPSSLMPLHAALHRTGFL